MEFKSIYPYTQEVWAEYPPHVDVEVNVRLELAEKAFKDWRVESFDARAQLMSRLADLLENEKNTCAHIITREMGKPLSEAVSEVEKCAWVCRHYAEHTERFLQTVAIEAGAAFSAVRYAPSGCVFAIMPWNFPFWQVFRFATPNLMAGNVGLLKHAQNTCACAEKIESLFREAGFPDGVFQQVRVDHEIAESIIAHSAVTGVTLTGSTRAGKAIAALAGKYIKKSVLELGGSNAFIVCEDADIDYALDTAITARYMNSGQSCIAAKRFILVGAMYDCFVEAFVERVRALPYGDPLENDTRVGPLARVDLAEALEQQMQVSVQAGAELLCGGERRDALFAPSVLAGVRSGMPAFDEETFGPLAAMVKAYDEDEALVLAKQSDYGLGASVFTRDTEKALAWASQVEDGALFINDLVKSDPRLPFGGTKQSGYGRELGREGVLEFLNTQTLYVKG